MKTKTILVTGGCRSGKSRYALKTASAIPGRRIYLATAEALDEEMKERIRKHRDERDPSWQTIEEPLEPWSVIEREGDSASVILLDCLTLWVSNALMRDQSAESILAEAKRIISASLRARATVILVTNEVGAGIVPENRLARDFRDIVGEVNQSIAGEFDEVVQVVSGIPVALKSPKPSPEADSLKEASGHEFSSDKKRGLYEAIFKRRDVRHFNSNPVPPETLGRVLKAAHHAGSVGYMQPWNFLVINDLAVKKQVADLFKSANEEAAKRFEGQRRELYNSLKLEGIMDAPVNICVTCDRTRFGPHVLGRNTMPEMDFFSAVCAVQNLWLAARAEGLGVGWVSILDPRELKEVLAIPDHVEPVAYLCVGYTDQFYDEPMLESKGWGKRLALDSLIFYDRWNRTQSSWKVRLPEEIP